LHAWAVSAAITVSSQNRLRFWLRPAFCISERLSVSDHAGVPQRGVLVVRESLLLATERAAGVPLEERRGGGELEAGDRRRASR